MADSPRITLRLTPKLDKAARAKADKLGIDLGSYVRHLLAADLGIEAPKMPTGLAAVKNKKVRKSVSRKGVAARWENKAE